MIAEVLESLPVGRGRIRMELSSQIHTRNVHGQIQIAFGDELTIALPATPPLMSIIRLHRSVSAPSPEGDDRFGGRRVSDPRSPLVTSIT